MPKEKYREERWQELAKAEMEAILANEDKTKETITNAPLTYLVDKTKIQDGFTGDQNYISYHDDEIDDAPYEPSEHPSHKSE